MKSLLVLLALVSAACAQQNLIPNWNFAGGLKSWRYDYPEQEAYVKNASCVKQVMVQGKRCAQLEVPPGGTEAPGVKIESALAPVDPGATYRVEVECLAKDDSARIFAEAYAPDTRSEEARAVAGKNRHVAELRLPPHDGRPALVQVYRELLGQASGAGKTWTPLEREFTVPLEQTIDHRRVQPAYVAIEVLVAGGHKIAKAYFTNFKLIRTRLATVAEGGKASSLR